MDEGSVRDVLDEPLGESNTSRTEPESIHGRILCITLLLYTFRSLIFTPSYFRVQFWVFLMMLKRERVAEHSHARDN